MIQRGRLNFTKFNLLTMYLYILLTTTIFTKIKYKLYVQGPMSKELHDTPPRKLHQTLTMIYPFYYIPMTQTVGINGKLQ